MFHNLGGLQQDTRVEKEETFLDVTDRQYRQLCAQITVGLRGQEVIFLFNLRVSVKE